MPKFTDTIYTLVSNHHTVWITESTTRIYTDVEKLNGMMQILRNIFMITNQY